MSTCGACDTGTNIFTTLPGTAVVVDGAATPINFAIDGNIEPFSDLKAIVTSIGMQAQGGFQFMHALRELIYVYVFTERMGELVVNGIAFPDTCNFGEFPADSPDNACTEGNTGLERIMTWYECNRITTRATPVTISIGDAVTYDAFLVSVKADIANAETGIAQFSFKFNYVPRGNDEDDFCFSTDDLACVFPPCNPPIS